MNGKSRTQVQIRKLTLAAVFMALTIILSTFSIPVPGGHLYFCDAAICTGAILLGDPIYAFIMGGSVPSWEMFFSIPLPCMCPLSHMDCRRP